MALCFCSTKKNFFSDYTSATKLIYTSLQTRFNVPALYQTSREPDVDLTQAKLAPYGGVNPNNPDVPADLSPRSPLGKNQGGFLKKSMRGKKAARMSRAVTGGGAGGDEDDVGPSVAARKSMASGATPGDGGDDIDDLADM